MAITQLLIEEARPFIPSVQAIRRKVFIEEKGFAPDDEWDGLDGDGSYHAIARARTTDQFWFKAVGTARLRMADDGYDGFLIQRLAVLKEFRRLGVGRALVAHLVARCDKWRTPLPAPISAYVLDEAVDFFLKCGFWYVDGATVGPDGLLMRYSPTIHPAKEVKE
jgi:GNAT superfamily N-acetyltransferase